MRVCEGGLDVNDPCNAKWDTKGCYATMDISYDEMEREGFDYTNLVTGQVKIFDPKKTESPVDSHTLVGDDKSPENNSLNTTTETESLTTKSPKGTETNKSVGMKAVSYLFAFPLLFI